MTEQEQNEIIRRQRERIDKAQKEALRQQRIMDLVKIGAVYFFMFLFVAAVLYFLYLDITQGVEK